MIPFDFVYCRPSGLAEALDAYHQLQAEGKNPVYYAGGSEIITMSRAGAIQPGAVVDIKSIPDCMLQSIDERGMNIGSACTLNKIKETKLFPLLSMVCGRIADHTNQCRITLGGNLCGTIIYRETSLPLLISDAEITLLGAGGLRSLQFESVFQRRVQLEPGELIVQIHVPGWSLKAPYFHVKRTQNEKNDYPLVSIAAVWKENELRIAFSGVCSYPFRSRQIEAVLNNRTVSCAARADKVVTLLPEHNFSDVKGSGEYRRFVLKNTLHALLEDWENGKI